MADGIMDHVYDSQAEEAQNSGFNFIQAQQQSSIFGRISGPSVFSAAQRCLPFPSLQDDTQNDTQNETAMSDTSGLSFDEAHDQEVLEDSQFFIQDGTQSNVADSPIIDYHEMYGPQTLQEHQLSQANTQPAYADSVTLATNRASFAEFQEDDSEFAAIFNRYSESDGFPDLPIFQDRPQPVQEDAQAYRFDPTKQSFFDLAPETRNKVYSFIFSGWIKFHRVKNCRWKRPSTDTQNAIFRTGLRISREAKSFMFEQSMIFMGCRCWSSGTASPFLCRRIRHIANHSYSSVKSRSSFFRMMNFKPHGLFFLKHVTISNRFEAYTSDPDSKEFTLLCELIKLLGSRVFRINFQLCYGRLPPRWWENDIHAVVMRPQIGARITRSRTLFLNIPQDIVLNSAESNRWISSLPVKDIVTNRADADETFKLVDDMSLYDAEHAEKITTTKGARRVGGIRGWYW